MIKRLKSAGGLEKAWIRLAALEFTFWAAMSVGNYQTVFLQSKGMAASQIGLLNAILSLVTISVTPIWGMISDRIRSVKKVFILGTAVFCLLFAFLPAVVNTGVGFLPICLFLGVTIAFRNPSVALIDNWLVRSCVDKRYDYGSIRLFGSIGYTLLGLSIAGIISAKGTTWTFPSCGIFMLVTLFVAFRTEDTSVGAKSVKVKSENGVKDLVRAKPYMLFLVFAFMVNIVINGISAFIPYLLESVGASGAKFGVVTAYTALLEVPMLLAAKLLRKRFPLSVLCVAGAFFFGVAGLLLGFFARGLSWIILFETFFGLGNGLIIASASNYVFTLVPDELKATGQGVYIASTATGAILGNFGGGMLIDIIGVRNTYVTLGIIAACAGLYLMMILSGRKVKKTA